MTRLGVKSGQRIRPPARRQPVRPGGRPNAALTALKDGARLAATPSRRNIIHWLSWVVTTSIVLALTLVLLDGRVFGWEQTLERRVQAVSIPGWILDITRNPLTDAYEGALVVLLAAVAAWLMRGRLESALIALVYPLHVVGNFPKAIVERERPSELFDGIIGVGGGKSFPSGHAEFAVTFFGFLTYLALIHVRGPVQRVALVSLWMAWAALVGFDRIHEGRHWPLDVAAGYVVGIGLLSGLIWLHHSLSRATRPTTANYAMPTPSKTSLVATGLQSTHPASNLGATAELVELDKSEQNYATPQVGRQHVAGPVCPGVHPLQTH